MRPFKLSVKLIERSAKRVDGVIVVFEYYSDGTINKTTPSVMDITVFELEEMRRKFDEFDDVPH